MFFSPELLSRRDSGFGLLWLAATLGAKSSFSKLPKRSVLTADISQLCTLIAEPNEPLALRLSSNLMIGVARVYKVKQEILLTDVTTCFNLLKKAFQDAHASGSPTAQLQMGQPSVRPDTVTITADPATAFAMNFDHLFAGWNERTPDLEEEEEDDSDDEFGRPKKVKKKGKGKASSISQAEQPRADMHTLKEHNDFLFSSSFDAAGGFGGLVPSSSQVKGGIDDNFLEGLDIAGDIGEELAKELGEGWGMFPIQPASDDQVNLNALNVDFGGTNDMNVDFQFGEDVDGPNAMASQIGVISPGRKRLHSELEQDAQAEGGSIILPLSPLGDEAVADGQAEQGDMPKKKVRRVRLLLDARTELTNEELERARSNYMEGQAEIRRELAQKKAEKDGMKMLEEMAWGPPRGTILVNAPALVQFWLHNFNIQVEARSGVTAGQKQVSNKTTSHNGNEAPFGDWNREPEIADDRMNFDMNFDAAGQAYGNDLAQEDYNLDSTRLRSSEEPGQARRASRPPSIVGSMFDFGLPQPDELKSGSQRSNMFPWDNAGVSSSISAAAFRAGGSDRMSIARADIRLRRSNSLARGSMGVPESPLSLVPSGFNFEPDPFEFAVPATGDNSGIDTQASDVSVMSLERNSFNFLEYVKMQLNAAPSAAASLDFANLAPRDTSTRHVAAAAFYHCLVLSTKDLIGLRQSEPYGVIHLTVQ